MIEAALLFLSVNLLTWPALFVILFLGMLADHFSHTKTAVMLGVISGVIAYMLFGVSLTTLGIVSAGYFIIGVLWSFWRYQRFVSKGIADIKSRTNINPEAKDRLIRELSPGRNKGNIVTWILVWPFSLVSNIAGDVINLTQKLVTGAFQKVYHKIFTSHIKDL